VERDAAMLRMLERSLRGHGFDLVCTSNERELLHLGRDASVDLVVFDLSPVSQSVWMMLHELSAERPELPVVYLAASDDVLPKPFALEELIGRIRRRTRGQNEPRPTVLHAGDLRLDLLARCGWFGEKLVELPAREFALLEYFMRHSGRALSRQAILADVWGYDEDPSSNVVDVYVRYLRNRLERVSGQRGFITTVRGVGYCFENPA
jgi:two-component system, OmpR family, copper resistance phosphate regulon response regulator CusR